MSSFVLKIIAMVTMLIDHSSKVIGTIGVRPALYPVLYVMNYIGRIAFPLYGYLLAEGVYYSKSKGKYALRLLILAFLSEIPFDIALRGNWYFPEKQNVFWTLLIGMLILWLATVVLKQTGRRRIFGMIGLVGAVLAGCYVADSVLITDYGMGGVLMIVIFGMGRLLRDSMIKWIPDPRVERTLVAAIAILVLSAWATFCLGAPSESFALLALIPIWFCNEKKGYSSKRIQIGCYLFYPVHLMLLYLFSLFVLLISQG